jgi:hypothetical protein
MTNPKESGAQTKVRPPNMIDVAMEDLSEVVRRKKLTCFQKTRTG